MIRAGRNSFIQNDTELNVAALDHTEDSVTSAFDEPHFHVGVTFRVTMQERGEYIVDHLRRCNYIECTGIAALKDEAGIDLPALPCGECCPGAVISARMCKWVAVLARLS